MADFLHLSDILYPECHLDSPIVTGKLVSILIYSKLPYNQELKDKTLIDNCLQNLSKGIKNNMINQQNYFREQLLQHYGDISKLYNVPYPYGNDYLFHIIDRKFSESLRQVLSYSHLCYRKVSNYFIKLMTLVESKLGINSNPNDEEYMSRLDSMEFLSQIIEGSKYYEPFLFWFTLKTYMRNIIKMSVSPTHKNKYCIDYFDTDNHYIQINRNLVMIIDKRNRTSYYFTLEMILMFCDVCEGRLMIDLAMSSDYRYKQFKVKGHKLWSLIDSLFIDLGNETYNIVALIEPLVLGFLQLYDDSYLLRGAFLEYCLRELKNELKNNGFESDHDYNIILSSLFDIFSIDDIHMIAEYFSFFRTFGHPTLEATEAANKVREYMNKPKLINFQVMMKGHALFCGTIINGFRDQHGGSWPPVILPDHVDKRIKHAYLNNEGLTDEMCITSWKSFVGFKFKCFMPLVLDEDLTMYMKDKALAAIKPEWDSVYPRENMCYITPHQSTSRRLVEVFLQDSEFDPANLINYVVSGDYLEDENFNLSYSLKEKEIKKVGRLFAKMTYQMRACQVVAESLIATGVGKYFKENGMVKDEHELLKTLHKLSVSSVPRDYKQGSEPEKFAGLRNSLGNNQFSNASANKNVYNCNEQIQYETVSTFLTTDLQKFCLNWRQETTNIFAERLNEIYGLPNFFCWLHKRLEKSVLYVADPNCPPYNKEHICIDNVDNSQIFIKYPMGGIEGYCQKLWTIITIPFLFLSAYESGTKIAAVVQGDNQAIAITRRVHPNLPYTEKKLLCSQLAQKYFERLRYNMDAIGHNLKANETIVSSHFFVYSKRIYYDGLVLSQALKPASRIVFWSETIVDETRSACSNISTAIAKAIEQGYSRWIGYCINFLKILEQLVVSLKFTINPSMTQDVTEPLMRNPYWIISAALLPSQLGGFNYLNMSRLYVRNIGDPVTASIADVKRMIQVNLLSERIIYKILYQPPGDCSYLDWASDPYSINIQNSQSVTTMLKNVTARSILQHSDNPMLRGLFHFDFEQEDKDLAEYLLNRSVIIPRAAHEIMDKSLTGARQEIAGMLDSTKGLIRNSFRLGGIRPRLIDRISCYDYEQFRTFNNLMMIEKEDHLLSPKACSVNIAKMIRRKMWAHLARGRIIYGLEVPDIIEAMNGYQLKSCEDCYYCLGGNVNFCWFFIPNCCSLDKVDKETNAMRVPYFGSTTEERSEIKLSSVKSASKALKAAIRIATVYTWAFGDSDECWQEAWYLASFRANITIEELKAITPISTSTNIAHRLRDKSTQMKYSSNSLNRVSRYTVISNDNLNFVIDGKKIDTNLIYQQVMLLGLSSLEDLFRLRLSTGIENTVYHLHVESNCCVVEMSDHPYIESNNILPVLQKVNCNKLIYDDNPIIEKDTIKIDQQNYRKGMLDFARWDIVQLEEGLAQSLAITIIEIITKETKDHLTEFKVLSNDDDINSLITEFIMVNPEQFSLYLGLAMSINWAYDIYYRRPEGKYQMVEYMNTIMNQTSKSYFMVLSNAFSHPKVFAKFWDQGLVEPIYGPNLHTQDYTRIAIDFLVLSYQNYLDYWLSDNEVPYVITESDEEIIDQRFEVTQARHLCMLNNLYNTRDNMPKIRGLTSINKCFILSESLKHGKLLNISSYTWNLELLEVIIYPASFTYIRRGIIKHIRLRGSLSSEVIAYNKLQSNQKEPKIHLPYKYLTVKNKCDKLSLSLTIENLTSDDLRIFNTKRSYKENKNRWESHILRRIGINSTSCYKAVEIADYIIEHLDANGERLFLGEGSGAMMAVYYYMIGPTVCYFNTGVCDTEAIGQRVLNLLPSEFSLVAKNNMDNEVIMSNIKTLFNGKPESTWIGTLSSFTYIMNRIKPHSLSMVHSDMESSHQKDPDTILKEQCYAMCLAMNLSIRKSVYITKIAPKDDDYTEFIIKTLQDYYENVSIFIPFFSNPYSSEIYIICRNLRMELFVYPDYLLRKSNDYKISDLTQLKYKILNIKLQNFNNQRERLGYYSDYTKSQLYELCKIEKTLLSMGFSVNGPKIIKQICGHDVATGSANLLASINLNVNSLVNFVDPNREKNVFLDPYPLLDSSKVREMVISIGKKSLIYLFIYMKNKDKRIYKYHMDNLRKQSMVIDFTSDLYKVCIYKHLYNKLMNSGIKQILVLQMTSVEVKIWWKIIGYSFLTVEN
ncbi:large polymerase protein [Feline paramyxovirus 163]|nr:large polymerase protein [Feline paramyxovirus 163]BBG92175.1 large polymerase protein [Feline paramyxovirus 163]